MSEYKGKICDVCGRPMTEQDVIPECVTATRKFGIAPHPEIEIYLELKKVTCEYFALTEGDICIECLCDVFKDPSSFAIVPKIKRGGDDSASEFPV